MVNRTKIRVFGQGTDLADIWGDITLRQGQLIAEGLGSYLTLFVQERHK